MYFFRLQQKKRSYDPIDYASIDLVDFWVTEEVEEPELPNDIQELIYQDNCVPSYHGGGFYSLLYKYFSHKLYYILLICFVFY